MRISGNTDLGTLSISKPTINNSSVSESVVKQGSKTTLKSQPEATEKVQSLAIDNSEETKEKVQDVVNKMNEMLEVTNNTSKFMYHEGLDRYYVTIVDRETEEVVKEVPPKRLLDSYYEMQKMLGMIVDEKI